MRTEIFDFHLPEYLIAQTPSAPRDSSRCFVVQRATGETSHIHFRDIPRYLNSGDVLIRNISKVIPARIMTIKEKTTTAIEVLLLERKENATWQCLLKPGKKVRTGTILIANADQRTPLCVRTINDDGTYDLEFLVENDAIMETLNAIGEIPLPPYISTRTTTTNEDYQTVYAQTAGSAAAPTAGLHFTERLITALNHQGVIIDNITLHVGLGTFKPIKTENIEDHIIHTEHFTISKNTWETIARAKREGRRVIAVGTTSARVLEECGERTPTFDASGTYTASTNIYITPTHQWMIVDGLITNFHIPKSSLVVLVASLLGVKQLLQYYEEAINRGYRFYSFGDAMFIL